MEFLPKEDNNTIEQLSPTEHQKDEVQKEEIGVADDPANTLTNEIFETTKLKVEPDDPTVLLIIAIEKLLEKKTDAIFSNIEAESTNITENIIEHQQKIDTAFDVKLNNLKEILEKLENQKEAIVGDVWQKMEQRTNQKIQNMLENGMKEIAKNSNNKVNNERMLLKGIVIGLFVGLVLCAVLLFMFDILPPLN